MDFGLRALRLDDFFLSFWLGLASVTLFLLLWNFLFPVNALAMTLVLSVGLLAFLSNRHEVGRILEGEDWRPGLLTWLLLAMLGLWLANLAIAPLSNADSALYHLQAVRWAERFPAIPGIGNLDGPLAFNNAYLLFDAMLGTGFWEGRANHIANGLLVLVFLAQCVIAGARIAGGTRDPRRVFEFLLLAAGVHLALNGNVSSFTTDLAPSLVLLVVAVQLYTMWSVEDELYAQHSYRFFAIGMLLAAAVSFKMNAAPFAATSFPLAILLWARKHKATMSVVKTSRMAVAAVGVFAAVVMARGLVLSGYPFFPASFGGFPVEWRVPAEHADAELAYIVHSGRASTQNFPVVAGEAGLQRVVPTLVSSCPGGPVRYRRAIWRDDAGGQRTSRQTRQRSLIIVGAQHWLVAAPADSRFCRGVVRHWPRATLCCSLLLGTRVVMRCGGVQAPPGFSEVGHHIVDAGRCSARRFAGSREPGDCTGVFFHAIRASTQGHFQSQLQSSRR